jgi:hypothetical protein
MSLENAHVNQSPYRSQVDIDRFGMAASAREKAKATINHFLDIFFGEAWRFQRILPISYSVRAH